MRYIYTAYYTLCTYTYGTTNFIVRMYIRTYKIICIQESRCLATVPLLKECLVKEKVLILRGKRFRPERYVYGSACICSCMYMHVSSLISSPIPTNEGEDLVYIYYRSLGFRHSLSCVPVRVVFASS